MPNVFDRAEDFRDRAAELRAIADEMSDPTARESLIAVAGALEEHAAKLKEGLLRVRCLQEEGVGGEQGAASTAAAILSRVYRRH